MVIKSQRVEHQSINKFVLKIRQILGSHELKAMVIFDNAHSKIIETIFCSAEFVPTFKKSICSICSLLRYSQF